MLKTRQLERRIESDFFKGKIILLLGARQEGKSTLFHKMPAPCLKIL